MNNLIFGFVAIFGVLIFSVEGSWSSYIQMHSLVIVVAGTAAILVFSTPGPVLRALFWSIVHLFKTDETTALFKEDLIALAESRTAKLQNTHKLVQYGQELWSQGIDPDLFIVLLSQKRKELDAKTADVVQALKNLSKYPPTLGMTGTVIGMINLFSALDSNRSNIGSALSTAMTATFLGLILSNVIISPLADRLHIKQVTQLRILDNCYEILLLINQGEPTTLIRGEMNERSAA